MLAYKLTAAVDECGGSFLLGGLVVPASGELNFHCSCRADRAYTKEERGVTGDNLSIGESTDITDLSLVSLELAGSDHLVELHACGNACKIATLVDGSESIVEIVKLRCVSCCTCGMAELNLGMLSSSLGEIALMTKRVSKDDGAAAVNEVESSLFAFVGLGDVLLLDVLNAELVACGLGSLDEVLVVGGVLIVKVDEADLHLLAVLVAVTAAGSKGKNHCKSENKCENFLEIFQCFFLPVFFILSVMSQRQFFRCPLIL